VIVASLCAYVRDRRCVVLGAAPLSAPITVAPDEVVIAVNGGISSYGCADVWVLNAREQLPTAGGKLGALMLRQGASRRVDVAVLLLKAARTPAPPRCAAWPHNTPPPPTSSSSSNPPAIKSKHPPAPARPT